MKKLIYLLAIGIGLGMVSCSKDKASEAGSGLLVLTVSSVNIDEGDEVTFSVTADGQPVDADIYIGGEKINGTEHTFADSGTYPAVAKKDGHTDSEAVSIDVYAVDVHVVGYLSNEIGSERVAKYWRFPANGVGNVTEVDLPAVGSQSAEAFDIAVYNGDVYMVGAEHNGTRNVAKYWYFPAGEAGNGTAIDLSDGNHSASAQGIAVHNGDVHVVGYRSDVGRHVAKYWRFPVGGAEISTAIDLSDGSQHTEAKGIAVHHGDAYVAGSKHNGTRNVAKYWHVPASDAGSSKAIDLSDGSQHAEAFDITVYNGDVHVVGSESNGIRNVAKYWHVPTGGGVTNVTAVDLSDGSRGSFATGIAAHNGEVYVVGEESHSSFWYVAKHWHMPAGGAGKVTEVELNDESRYTVASSIAVQNGGTYVVGFERHVGQNVAKYWHFPADGDIREVALGLIGNQQQNSFARAIAIERTLR